MSDPTNADADDTQHTKDDDVTVPEATTDKARKSELLDAGVETSRSGRDRQTCGAPLAEVVAQVAAGGRAEAEAAVTLPATARDRLRRRS